MNQTIQTLKALGKLVVVVENADIKRSRTCVF